MKKRKGKMSDVFLIRVGIDSTSGGFVAPYFKEDKNILYIPLFDYSKKENPRLKSFEKISTNYPKINLINFFPKDQIKDKDYSYDINEIKVHYDPEFVTNTYGNRRLNALRKLKEDDYILFYGSFYPCSKDFKYKKYTLFQLKKIQERKKQFYIFAYIRLKYPPITIKNYKIYYKEIKNNAHISRGDFKKGENIIILKGKRDSGYIKPIRIDNGKIINGTYQMNNFLFKYKLTNQRGINRCYCKLKTSIINEILNNKF